MIGIRGRIDQDQAEAAAVADSFGKYPGDSEIFGDPSSLKDYL